MMQNLHCLFRAERDVNGGGGEMISVVIPTHNREELIARAVRSVQNQTYKDLEILVVSDGSTDGTKAVVESLAKDDDRIRFIEYFPAKGGNTARNTGIKASQGEYVAFLDDDDEWLSDKLECQIKVMESSEKIGLVYTGVHIIYLNEKAEYSFRAKEHGDLKERILIDNCIGTTSTVMVRRSLFEKTGLFDEALKARQDYDLWIRFCQVCETGCVPDEKINYYNDTGKVQVSSSTQKYADAIEQINQKYRNEICGLSAEDKVRKKTGEYFFLCNTAMRNGEVKDARKYALAAAKAGGGIKAYLFMFVSFLPYRVVLLIRGRM
jgi:glycosyltransferase involved in cell wall biosynthesis